MVAMPLSPPSVVDAVCIGYIPLQIQNEADEALEALDLDDVTVSNDGSLSYQGQKLKTALSSWKTIVGEIRRCGQGVITVADFVRHHRQASSRSSVEAFAFVYLSTSERPSSIRVALLQKLVNPWCACALCTSNPASASQEAEMPTLKSLLPRLSWLTARIAKSDGYQIIRKKDDMPRGGKSLLHHLNAADDDDDGGDDDGGKSCSQASLSESPLGLLGEDVLREEVLYRLDSRSLACLGSTCRYLFDLTRDIVADLRVKLFPHQKAALTRMLECEVFFSKTPCSSAGRTRTIRDPEFRLYKAHTGENIYISQLNGCISFSEDSIQIPRVRGGLLCDEPGLGKTVTSLALISKTKGALAQIDQNENAQVQVDETLAQNRLIEYARRRNMANEGEARKDALLKEYRRRFQWYCLSETDAINAFVKPKRRVAAALANVKIVGGYSKARNIKRDTGNTIAQRPEIKAQTQQSQPTDSPQPLSKKLFWVCCDQCDKWRLINARQYQVLQKTSKWFCHMGGISCTDVEVTLASANSPHDSSLKYNIENWPGFVARNKPDSSSENIAFFKEKLHDLIPQLVNQMKSNAVAVLAMMSPREATEKLDAGYFVTAEKRIPNHYEVCLKQLGLRQGEGSRAMKHTWYLPNGVKSSALTFDTTSLHSAYTDLVEQCKNTSNDLASYSPMVRKAQIASTFSRNSRRIFISGATLLVCPSILIQHWLQQAQFHCPNLKVCSLRDAQKKWQSALRDGCQASDLAAYIAWEFDLVLVSLEKLSNEGSTTLPDSVLMQVHWLRVMIDEGHTLGSSLAPTSKLIMAQALRADRRWIITGTPTPALSLSKSVPHLLPLLSFLRDPVYGQRPRLFQAIISRPIEQEKREGVIYVKKLLEDFMVRSAKEDLSSLIPPVTHTVVMLDFEAEHAKSYNSLVDVIRRNLMLADWFDPAHKESLLHSSQLKYQRQTLRQLQLSTCVAGHINIQSTDSDIRETIQTLFFYQQINSAARHRLRKAGDNGSNAAHRVALPETSSAVEMDLSLVTTIARLEHQLRHGGNCYSCGEMSHLPVVTPCLCLFCSDCVSKSRERCIQCNTAYNMEPGEYDSSKLVPYELIELQPSYRSDSLWRADWEKTTSSKVKYLLEKIESYGADARIIVFSQFLEHLYLVEESIAERDISFKGLYSTGKGQLSSKLRQEAIDDFRCGKVSVLLMDMTGSLGLDLSNCTHVFLLEPILDASVEDQIVSRAHRMGQRNKVQVQTLAMKHTVEEKVVRLRIPSWQERFDFCQGIDDRNDSPQSASALNLPSTTSMLLTLSKVRHRSLPPPPPLQPLSPWGGVGDSGHSSKRSSASAAPSAEPKPKRKRVRFNVTDDGDDDGNGERKECHPPQGGDGPAYSGPACKDISDMVLKFICSLNLGMNDSVCIILLKEHLWTLVSSCSWESILQFYAKASIHCRRAECNESDSKVSSSNRHLISLEPGLKATGAGSPPKRRNRDRGLQQYVSFKSESSSSLEEWPGWVGRSLAEFIKEYSEGMDRS